ncbi:hypothetical protein BX616_002742 [Lobosporangium transversale]|nr:hypothetical protein BX616_002742 [Lobosporangium transversale]
MDFTPEEIIDLKEAFANYDKDKNGRIATSELKQLIQQDVSDETLANVIKQFDTNGDGELDFNEFVGLMKALRSIDE